MLAVYYIATDTISYYEGNGIAIRPQDMYAISTNLYIIGQEYGSTGFGMILKTSVADPSSNSKLLTSTSVMTAFTTGTYQVTTLVVNSTTLLNVTLTNTASISPVSMAISNTSSSTSDVSLYSDDLILTSLISTTVYSESLYLT